MTPQTTQRTLKGEVVSGSMDKTLVVRVDRTVVHSKYGKRYIKSKKYHVHDERKTHNVGDVVEFQASRPYSKTKRWRVLAQR